MLPVKYKFPLLLSGVLFCVIWSCNHSTVSGGNTAEPAPVPPPYRDMILKTKIVTGLGAAQYHEERHTYELPEAGPPAIVSMQPPDEIQSEFPLFRLASILVGEFEWLLFFHNMHFDFGLKNLDPVDAVITGNEYVWNYDVYNPVGNNEISVRASTSIQNGLFSWMATGESNNAGFIIREPKVLSGTTTFDGKRGKMEVLFKTSRDIIENDISSYLEWQMEDETLSELFFDYHSVQTVNHPEHGKNSIFTSVSGTYTFDGTTAAIRDVIQNYDIEVPDVPFSELRDYFRPTRPFTVTWNVTTGAGTYESIDQRHCWNANRRVTAC